MCIILSPKITGMLKNECYNCMNNTCQVINSKFPVKCSVLANLFTSSSWNQNFNKSELSLKVSPTQYTPTNVFYGRCCSITSSCFLYAHYMCIHQLCVLTHWVALRPTFIILLFLSRWFYSSRGKHWYLINGLINWPISHVSMLLNHWVALHPTLLFYSV